MNSISIVRYALARAWSHRRLVWVVYIFQLILAITIGLQVYQVIEASIGQSTNLDKLITGFDYTVIQDLINIHGASISPLIGQLRWYVLAYLIFSAFMQAGVLYVVVHRLDNWLSFWKGAALYFFKFLLFGLLFVLLFIVWTLLVWTPYASNLFYMVEHWVNEPMIIYLLIGLTILYCLGAVFLFSWSLLARLYFMRDGFPFFKSIRLGLVKVFSQFRLVYSIAFLFALLIGLLYYANLCLEWYIGIKTEFLIIAFFIIQQAVVWFKLLIRVAVYTAYAAIK